jgi:hypothetical protein
MKKLNALGFAVLLSASALFTSCDKEAFDDTIATANPSSEESLLSSQAIVVNAISNSALTDLGININGVALAAGLDYKDLTDYLDLETGEVILDLVAENGTILASTSYTFEENELYNIVILLDEDGVTPVIKVLGIDPTDFVISDTFGSELGLEIGDLSTYAVNVVNYTVGVQGQNLILGLDYVGAGSTTITGLLDLQYGVLSGVFFGSNDVLDNIDLLTSSLGIEDLLDELNTQSGGVLDVLDLGGAFGVGEILTGGSPSGLLGSVLGLIDGILGGNNSPLDVLSAELLDGVDFLPGHNYTIILTGAGQTLDFIIIDQTVAGLLEVIE